MFIYLVRIREIEKGEEEKKSFGTKPLLCWQHAQPNKKNTKSRVSVT